MSTLPQIITTTLKQNLSYQAPDGFAIAPAAQAVDLTAKSAAIADTVFFTTTCAGLYLIAGDICITTVGTGSGNTNQLVMKAKDESGTSVSLSGAAATALALGTPSQVCTVMYLAAGTTISYSEVDGGTQTTHAVFNLHVAVTQLA
jgi:hypothetical protein